MAAYTEALGDEICKLTAGSSIGLRRICLQLRQPYSTVTDWIYKNLHGFADKYAQAKQLQRDRLAEEMLEIADDDSYDRPGDSIRRAKLRIDVRKWLLANLAAEELENKEEEENGPVNIIIKRSSPQPPGPLENTPQPEPQYDQPGAMPAMQNKASLSPDAILEDKKESESKENIVDNIALRSVSSTLISRASSPENAAITSRSNTEGGEPAPGEFVEFAPGRWGRTYPCGCQPGLYR